jgi:hypothetical protein
MGYLEQIMGDREQVLYRTHRHWIVLTRQTLGWAFAFVVFLSVALAMFFLPKDPEGTKYRFAIGLIALFSVGMPIFLVLRAWRRGARGHTLVGQIWRPVVAGLLILVVAVLTMVRPDLPYLGWVALALALFALLQAVRSFMDWLNERFLVTNRRVVQIRGIVNKQVSDSALEKVNDVVMQQSVVGRLLGYGSVEIITGSDIGLNEFRRIANPVKFKRAMLNAKESLHDTGEGERVDYAAAQAPMSAAVGQSSAQASPASGDIPDLIAELDDLRQRGILSEEEFQAKKRDLLNRL